MGKTSADNLNIVINKSIEQHWLRVNSREKDYHNFALGKRTARFFQPAVISPETGETIGNRKVSRCYPGFVGNPKTGQCEPADTMANQSKKNDPLGDTQESDRDDVDAQVETEQDLQEKRAQELNDFVKDFYDKTKDNPLRGMRCKSSTINCLKPPCEDHCSEDGEYTELINETARRFAENYSQQEDRPGEISMLVKRLLASDWDSEQDIKDFLNQEWDNGLLDKHFNSLKEKYDYDDDFLFLDNVYLSTNDGFVVRYDTSKGAYAYMGVENNSTVKYRDENEIVTQNPYYNPCPIPRKEFVSFSQNQQTASCTNLINTPAQLQGIQPGSLDDLFNNIKGWEALENFLNDTTKEIHRYTSDGQSDKKSNQHAFLSDGTTELTITQFKIDLSAIKNAEPGEQQREKLQALIDKYNITTEFKKTAKIKMGLRIEDRPVQKKTFATDNAAAKFIHKLINKYRVETEGIDVEHIFIKMTEDRWKPNLGVSANFSGRIGEMEDAKGKEILENIFSTQAYGEFFLPESVTVNSMADLIKNFKDHRENILDDALNQIPKMLQQSMSKNEDIDLIKEVYGSSDAEIKGYFNDIDKSIITYKNNMQRARDAHQRCKNSNSTDCDDELYNDLSGSFAGLVEDVHRNPKLEGKIRSAILKNMAEVHIYTSELAQGKKVLLPQNGQFPGVDKLLFEGGNDSASERDEDSLIGEVITGISIKYSTTLVKEAGFPAGADQLARFAVFDDNVVPSETQELWKSALGTTPGVEGESFGVSDALVNEKNIGELLNIGYGADEPLIKDVLKFIFGEKEDDLNIRKIKEALDGGTAIDAKGLYKPYIYSSKKFNFIDQTEGVPDLSFSPKDRDRLKEILSQGDFLSNNFSNKQQEMMLEHIPGFLNILLTGAIVKKSNGLDRIKHVNLIVDPNARTTEIHAYHGSEDFRSWGTKDDLGVTSKQKTVRRRGVRLGTQNGPDYEGFRKSSNASTTDPTPNTPTESKIQAQDISSQIVGQKIQSNDSSSIFIEDSQTIGDTVNFDPLKEIRDELHSIREFFKNKGVSVEDIEHLIKKEKLGEFS